MYEVSKLIKLSPKRVVELDNVGQLKQINSLNSALNNYIVLQEL